MTTYQITSSAGVDMGTWEAGSENEAVDLAAIDAGYDGAADAEARVPGWSRGLRVRDVDSGYVDPTRFRVEVRGEWAGVTGGWRPAVDGTVNATGRPRDEASLFDSYLAAREAVDVLVEQGADPDHVRIVQV